MKTVKHTILLHIQNEPRSTSHDHKYAYTHEMSEANVFFFLSLFFFARFNQSRVTQKHIYFYWFHFWHWNRHKLSSKWTVGCLKWKRKQRRKKIFKKAPQPFEHVRNVYTSKLKRWFRSKTDYFRTHTSRVEFDVDDEWMLAKLKRNEDRGRERDGEKHGIVLRVAFGQPSAVKVESRIQ